MAATSLSLLLLFLTTLARASHNPIGFVKSHTNPGDFLPVANNSRISISPSITGLRLCLHQDLNQACFNGAAVQASRNLPLGHIITPHCEELTWDLQHAYPIKGTLDTNAHCTTLLLNPNTPTPYNLTSVWAPRIQFPALPDDLLAQASHLMAVNPNNHTIAVDTTRCTAIDDAHANIVRLSTACTLVWSNTITHAKA